MLGHVRRQKLDNSGKAVGAKCTCHPVSCFRAARTSREELTRWCLERRPRPACVSVGDPRALCTPASREGLPRTRKQEVPAFRGAVRGRESLTQRPSGRPGRGPPAEGVGKALDSTVFVLGSEERLREPQVEVETGRRAEWKGLPGGALGRSGGRCTW